MYFLTATFWCCGSFVLDKWYVLKKLNFTNMQESKKQKVSHFFVIKHKNTYIYL